MTPRSLSLLIPLALLSAACAPVAAGGDGDAKGGDAPDIGDDGDDDGDVGEDGDDGDDLPDDQRDDDGDGVVAADDCDDDDPDTYPGADESHDGVDNDCDGWVDEVEVCADPSATIQSTADAAPDGATILICAGVWPEQLLLEGRELMLAGEEGAEATIVTGSAAGRPLRVSGGDISVVGLTLTEGVGDTGGGAQCASGAMSLVESIVSASSADNGGGVGATDCALELVDTQVRDNTATTYGGGVYAEDCTGAFDGAWVEGNVAYEGGGAFLWRGGMDLSDSDFVGNEATTVAEDDWGPGGGGGGLWSGSNGTVSDSRFVENHSGYHAGGAYFYGGTPVVRDNTIADNTCGEDGAGVYFNQSRAEIVGNTITGNIAADDAGGFRHYIGSSLIQGNTISGNSCGDDGGGAKMSHSEHEFFDNVLEDNEAGDAGGGLELDNDSSHVAGCTFRGNRSHRGAGLHNWRTEARFFIEDSVFEGNAATDCGGGLNFDNSPYIITVRDLWIEGNTANDGAGLCVDRVYRDPDDVGGAEGYFQDTLLDVYNVALTGNVAADDGGAVYVRAGQIELSNITVADNEGADIAAIVVKGSTVSLHNSIVSGSSGGPALGVEDTEDGAGTLDVSWTLFWDNDDRVRGMEDPVGSDGNASGDPRLDGSLGLRSGSAAIDAGDPSLSDPDGTRSDMGWTGGPGAR